MSVMDTSLRESLRALRLSGIQRRQGSRFVFQRGIPARRHIGTGL